MDLKNKILWITGASSGIGKSLAINLSKENAKLILSSRNKEALLKVKSSCKNQENIVVFPLDLNEHAALPSKVTEAMSFFGNIDVLVNNGGISQLSLAKDTNIMVDKKLMDVNYIGTVALIKAILLYFIENEKGHLVVTTSIVGKIGRSLRFSYATTKHALHGFFDSLRAEILKENIK